MGSMVALLRLRKQQKIIAEMAVPIAKRPPTTPPAMEPATELCDVAGVLVAGGMGAGGLVVDELVEIDLEKGDELAAARLV